MARTKLIAPAYANELRAARALGEVNLHAHVGRNAWLRANRSGHRPRLIVDLRDRDAAGFNFTCCAGLQLVLNAHGSLDEARAVAVRMCEHGAQLVVLLHDALPHHSQFVYGVRR
jgi:hypothetical protein